MIEDLRALLAQGNIVLTDEAQERLLAYHRLLLEWNARMDLTNVPEEEMALRHYADSLLPLARKEWFPDGARLIDVGTGAGFLDMPLLILRPDLQMTFLDALSKRIGFLEDALKRLNLAATALHARAEDAARLDMHREAYDAAVSRAVASSATLQELTLPFVKTGGLAIAWKGPGVQEELVAAKRAAFVLGGTVRGISPAPVPGREDWAHCLLIIDKTGRTPKAYPRKAGTPGRKPLA